MQTRSTTPLFLYFSTVENPCQYSIKSHLLAKIEVVHFFIPLAVRRFFKQLIRLIRDLECLHIYKQSQMHVGREVVQNLINKKFTKTMNQKRNAFVQICDREGAGTELKGAACRLSGGRCTTERKENMRRRACRVCRKSAEIEARDHYIPVALAFRFSLVCACSEVYTDQSIS